MKAVTIDQLDIKDHVRWAQDQEDYDISFVNESHLVAHFPEILGTSVIYPSKFEELFELQKRNLPWAAFAPPKNFYLFSKRFFSYRLFPNLDWENEKGEEEGKKDSSEEEDFALIQEVTRIKKFANQTQPLFDKDRGTILNLLESIKWINHLLKQINARKLQYQKG
ncbi:MAG: DUF5399 family protein [Rhabdochlamydiaceae bacterium]|jgi:hypothetical protein